MNIIQSFNGTMAYIERTIETGCDEAEIARISGYSYPLFSRIFSILVGYPLNEYLRFRKLSRVAADLRNTDAKIIDIALAYGYESPDSFAKAAELGLSVMHIPEAEYAVVHQGWKYVMETFFPEQGYCHAGTPDFEAYSEGDMYSKNYTMELWVPIVKA